MPICIVENGTIVNVADLRMVRVRNASKSDYQIELYFKGVRDPFVVYFLDNKHERDRVFLQIQKKMYNLG